MCTVYFTVCLYECLRDKMLEIKGLKLINSAQDFLVLLGETKILCALYTHFSFKLNFIENKFIKPHKPSSHKIRKHFN